MIFHLLSSSINKLIPFCQNSWKIYYTKTFARASAPALAIYGLEGWKPTSKIASSNFFLWAVISCTHCLESSCQRRIEQSWLPESRYRPFGSTARLVTESRCATIDCTRRPEVLSQKRMCRSSCPVMVNGNVGCETTRFICLPIALPCESLSVSKRMTGFPVSMSNITQLAVVKLHTSDC